MTSERIRTWSELPLTRRIGHCLLFLGIPVAVWEAWDIFHESVVDPDLKTAQLASGIMFALLAGILVAFTAALLEHGFFLAWKKKRISAK